MKITNDNNDTIKIMNDCKKFYNYNEININNIINELENKKILKKIFNTIDIINTNNNDNLRNGYISEIYNYTIDKTNNIILKIGNNNNSLTEIANKLELYKNEIFFYKNIYENIKNTINIPYYYDSYYEKSLIILKDLNDNKGSFNINLNENNNLIYKIIDEISKLHINYTFIDNKNNLNIKKINDFNYYDIIIKNRFDIFINKIFSNKLKNFFINIYNNFNNIINELSSYPLSLCHGDLKSPNIFYKDYNNPYFIDFQYVNLNKGISDIIFLLIESVNFDEKLYINIINYYYEKIKNNISYISYKKDLKNSLCIFPFIVAVWFNTEDINNLNDKNFPTKFLNNLIKYYEFEFNI